LLQIITSNHARIRSAAATEGDRTMVASLREGAPIAEYFR
jgi:hypothetical protein